MDIGIRSRLTTGFAAVSAGVLVMTPAVAGQPPATHTTPAAPAAVRAPALILTAATQPSAAAALVTQPAMTPAAQLLRNPLNPLVQQVGFNVAFLTDFVTTGAVLFGREFAIPGALLQAVQHGTPVPAALGSALQTFAQIELQAGRDLLGFAVQYVSFQLKFFTGLVAMPVAALTRQPTAQLSNAATTVPQTVTGTLHPQKVKSAVSVGSTQTGGSDVTHKRNTVKPVGALVHSRARS